MPFRLNTDYSSENETLEDSLWDAISTDGGVVAVSEEYVQSKGLPQARKFDWDEGKRVYYIHGFHLLHCVVSIATMTYCLKLIIIETHP